MNDFELQQLLRQKKCDVPSPESVEDFILNFQRRQRMALIKPSFFQQIQEHIMTFFSDFQVPTLAYVGATAIALFLCVLILNGTHVARNSMYANQHSLLNDGPSRINSFSSPAAHRIEPVSLDINQNDRDDNSLVSPLSYILKKKPASSHSLSF